MPFQSILYNHERPDELNRHIPDCFTDLHLDQVVDQMTKAKEQYDLKPFFYTCLQDLTTIVYRQQVMKELEQDKVMDAIRQFADAMEQIRLLLKHAENCLHACQKERFFLDAVIAYCSSLQYLQEQLDVLPLNAEGLCMFREYLSAYSAAPSFIALTAESAQLLSELQDVTYELHIQELTIQVLPAGLTGNYTAETKELYEKFYSGNMKEYTAAFPFSTEMNDVEARILKGVATLYPDLFASLCNFYNSNQGFADPAILSFDREVQFYIACLEYFSRIKAQGLVFCYPGIATGPGSVYARETFDIALAYTLTARKEAIICNDFMLSGQERILIVSGPNQGGKTTFARTFGQLHYLAALGCPVPGSGARLMLSDSIYTHFEREEDIGTHRSKFEEDLIRIHTILSKASSKSIIIFNELFSSTTLQDALFLCQKIMEYLIRLNNYCVWVTFIDELATLSNTSVSMMSTVMPGHPDTRTFKIIRKAPDGLAYALSIAGKYHLTYPQLKERIRS